MMATSITPGNDIGQIQSGTNSNLVRSRKCFGTPKALKNSAPAADRMKVGLRIHWTLRQRPVSFHHLREIQIQHSQRFGALDEFPQSTANIFAVSSLQ